MGIQPGFVSWSRDLGLKKAGVEGSLGVSGGDSVWDRGEIWGSCQENDDWNLEAAACWECQDHVLSNLLFFISTFCPLSLKGPKEELKQGLEMFLHQGNFLSHSISKTLQQIQQWNDLLHRDGHRGGSVFLLTERWWSRMKLVFALLHPYLHHFVCD